MSAPVVSFFNNKGGVGKTTLVYHVGWMAAELGYRVLAVDLDPQANLTAVSLEESAIERLWANERQTIYGAVSPLLDGLGDLRDVDPQRIDRNLSLLPGDLKLAAAEQEFGQQWSNALDRNARAFRVVSAPARAIRAAAETVDADVVVVDVGPSLGAINRLAMVASDYVVVPMSPDLYSIQGLRNLGPTIRQWGQEWVDRRQRAEVSDLWLPEGSMTPVGYVVLQHGVRTSRVVQAYDRWIRRIPGEYRSSVLDVPPGDHEVPSAADDVNCLGLVKHYHSLVPMAQEARKPMFNLKSADGAIGAHQAAVSASHAFFRDLVMTIMDRVGVVTDPGRH